MPEFLNIISIACNISLGFVESSSENETKQVVLTKHIQHLFNLAVKHINKTNRIAIVAGNSAEISFTGPSEDAVLLATDIFNMVSTSNKHCSTKLIPRIGIHLETISMVENVSEHPKTIRNGINVAKQLMNLAKPNEILVSHSFYEIISLANQSHITLYKEVVIKHDQHIADFRKHLAIPKLAKALEIELTHLNKQNSSTQNLEISYKSKLLNSNLPKYVTAGLIIAVLITTTDELSLYTSHKPDVIITPKQSATNLNSQPSTASFLRVHYIEPESAQQNVTEENPIVAQVKSYPRSISTIESKKPKKIDTSKEVIIETFANTNKPEDEEIIISEASKNDEIIMPLPTNYGRPEQRMGCSQAVKALNQCH